MRQANKKPDMTFVLAMELLYVTGLGRFEMELLYVTGLGCFVMELLYVTGLGCLVMELLYVTGLGCFVMALLYVTGLRKKIKKNNRFMRELHGKTSKSPEERHKRGVAFAAILQTSAIGIKSLQEKLNDMAAANTEAFQQIPNGLFPAKTEMYSSMQISCPFTCNDTWMIYPPVTRGMLCQFPYILQNDRSLEEKRCRLFQEFQQAGSVLRFPYPIHDGNGEEREANLPNHMWAERKKMHAFCSDSNRCYHDNEASAVADFLAAKITRSQYVALLVEAALLRSLHGLVIYGWLDTGHAKSIVRVLYTTPKKSPRDSTDFVGVFQFGRQAKNREMNLKLLIPQLLDNIHSTFFPDLFLTSRRAKRETTGILF